MTGKVQDFRMFHVPAWEMIIVRREESRKGARHGCRWLRGTRVSRGLTQVRKSRKSGGFRLVLRSAGIRPTPGEAKFQYQ